MTELIILYILSGLIILNIIPIIVVMFSCFKNKETSGFLGWFCALLHCLMNLMWLSDKISITA